ncbi:uncharacterized protein IL334_006184 [Kwoniella shivajii]|uniref:Uncharacterized protein n=1 Tax=Kwoniella shivajii TaxID=564305 RepID=A0ABZ1D744_9TREE|nr:hypothetical protein IL334_006184 [Kwoniella shivajii]
MSVARELNRVRLEPSNRSQEQEEENDSSSSNIVESDVESDPSDEDPDTVNEYAVDAIKWAKYRDSKWDRQEGYKGWHYGVMWNGYLKSGSETEEPYGQFDMVGGKAPLITEFWKELGVTIPERRKEPTGRLGQVFETPSRLMRKWFRQNKTVKRIKGEKYKYRRDYETYKRRRAKEIRRELMERQLKPVPVDLLTKKADSDYYLFKKQVKEKRRHQRALANNPNLEKPSTEQQSSRSTTPVAAATGTNTGASASTSRIRLAPLSVPHSNAVVSTASLGSPASTLGSVFDSDREDVDEDLDPASEEEVEQVENRSAPPKSTKRKAISTSPVASASASRPVEKNKKAKKEDKTSRLANIGKISKRVVSPPASEITFGDLQVGIFDSAPAESSTASTSASAAATANALIPTPVTASAMASPSASNFTPASRVDMGKSTSAVLVAPVAHATVPPTPTPPLAPVAPAPSNAVAAMLRQLNAKQAGAVSSPSPVPPQPVQQIQGSSSPSIPPSNESVPAHTAGPAQAIRLPPPPLLEPAYISNNNVAALPTEPRAMLASPAITFNASAPIGPNPGFSPAPPSRSSTIQKPTQLNRAKFTQPSRIQPIDTIVDPREARKIERLGIKDPHIKAQSVRPKALLPPKPSTSYAPRNTTANYPPEPYGQQPAEVAPWQHRQQGQPARNGNLSPNLAQLNTASDIVSPRFDYPSPPLRGPVPTGPRQVALDPRKQAQQASAAPPTPVATPIAANAEEKHVRFSLKPVDVTGGLVTFSPLLILRNPGKFVQVMKLCMTNPQWGAYLNPAALDFINRGWPIRHICPDATTAFSVLVQFLPLDDRLRDIAGAGITSGGGISISCCPPSPYQAEDCIKWKTWLYDVLKSTEYQELVALCEKYNTENLPPSFQNTLKAMNVGIIEDMQVEDLKKIKTRKNIVDYNRFVFVSEDRRVAQSEGVDYLTADEFIDLLQKSASGK